MDSREAIREAIADQLYAASDDLIVGPAGVDRLGLIATLALLDPGKHGFCWVDVAKVTAAWKSGHADIWSVGHVVELHDGRRAYLYAVVGADLKFLKSENAEFAEARLTVDWLEEDGTRPKLSWADMDGGNWIDESRLAPLIERFKTIRLF